MSLPHTQRTPRPTPRQIAVYALVLLLSSLPSTASAHPLTDPDLDHSYEIVHAGENHSFSNHDDIIFNYAYLFDVNFFAASLQRASFLGADLTDADFGQADVTDAAFDSAVLTDASFWYAIGTGATFRAATFVNTYLRWASLSGADFEGATFQDANLRNTDLSNANLSNVDFGNSDLKQANLSGANLVGADLSNATINGASNFSNAYYDPTTTQLPTGFDTSGLIPVPEPASFAMMLLGLMGLTLSGRRGRTKS